MEDLRTELLERYVLLSDIGEFSKMKLQVDTEFRFRILFIYVFTISLMLANK